MGVLNYLKIILSILIGISTIFIFPFTLDSIIILLLLFVIILDEILIISYESDLNDMARRKS